MKQNCSLKTTSKEFTVEAKARICGACQDAEGICETGREIVEAMKTKIASKRKNVDAILQMQQNLKTEEEKLISEDAIRRQTKEREIHVSQEMTKIAEKIVKMQQNSQER